MHEVQIRRAGRLARDGRRVAIGRMIQRVHGEPGCERVDVAGPVTPRAHAAVKEHEVRAAPVPVHRHAWPGVCGRLRAHIPRNHGTDRPVWTCYGNITIIWPAPGARTARRARLEIARGKGEPRSRLAPSASTYRPPPCS